MKGAAHRLRVNMLHYMNNPTNVTKGVIIGLATALHEFGVFSARERDLIIMWVNRGEGEVPLIEKINYLCE